MKIELMKGDKHPAVGVLQKALNDAGAMPKLAVDNDFGKLTKEAVRHYQERTPHRSPRIGGIMCFEELEALHIQRQVQELVAKQPLVHVETENWKKNLSFKRFRLSEYSVNPNTGKAEAVPGMAWQLSGYESLIGGRIDLYNGVFSFHSKKDPDRVERGKNECALLVQAFGCPKTSFWRRGPQVKTCPVIPVGTVIATLRDGVYYSDHSGRSHVGIFISRSANGITMIDQWNGRDIGTTPRAYDAKQDGTQMVKRENRSQYDDITLPAPACEGPSRGFTIAHLPMMRDYKFKWVGDGDEYYVMYSDNNASLKLV
jgi:hypothetical protein